jgi:hypothetical protein
LGAEGSAVGGGVDGEVEEGVFLVEEIRCTIGASGEGEELFFHAEDERRLVITRFLKGVKRFEPRQCEHGRR